MITRDNLAQVIDQIPSRDKKRILASNKEYVVIYLHCCNVGSWVTVTITNDYSRYQNVSNNGNCILTLDEVAPLLVDKWQVWDLDSWGNDEDGYQVNDRYKWVSIELVRGFSYRDLFKELKAQNIIKKHVKLKQLAIDGDDIFISIDLAKNGKPFFQLTKEE